MNPDVIVAALTLIGTIIVTFGGAWKLASRSNAKERTDAAKTMALERTEMAKAMALHIAQDRLDRLKEHADCEKRYGDLSAEIQKVRQEQTGEMSKVIRENAIALADMARASREGTAVLDRVCRHLVALPCARDGAERLKDLTPLGEHRTPRSEASA